MVIELTVHNTKTELHIRFGGIFLNLIFKLLMQTHPAVRNQNIINLLKVKVYMVVVVSILLFMFFTFLLLLCCSRCLVILSQIQLLFHMLGKIAFYHILRCDSTKSSPIGWIYR